MMEIITKKKKMKITCYCNYDQTLLFVYYFIRLSCYLGKSKKCIGYTILGTYVFVAISEINDLKTSRCSFDIIIICTYNWSIFCRYLIKKYLVFLKLI